MKDRILGRYIAKNHSDNVFTDRELQVIKQGDTDTREVLHYVQWLALEKNEC